MKIAGLGILYAFLWASGAIAAKIGLVSASPLIFAAVRLISAGMILFLFVYIYKKNYRYPKGAEWRHLIILGVLNTTLYVGCSFLALAYVDSTIFNLLITTNPFIVALLASIFLHRNLEKTEILGMVISALGIIIAIIPYTESLQTTLFGLITLGIGVLSMGIGSVYYNKIQLKLPQIVVNTWQIIFGSIIAIPFVFLFEPDFYIQFDQYFLIGLFWQVVMISIIAMILWFYLLKIDVVKANNFLFLTPIFGYVLSAIFLNDVLTVYHYAGALFVIAGTFFSQSGKKDNK
jgi:drug/metabolite transporter (DMT)-like permease